MSKGRASDAELYAAFQAGASYAELAERYGLNVDSVRGRVSRARRGGRAGVIQAAPLATDDDGPACPDDGPEIARRLAALTRLGRLARVLITSDEHLPDADPRALAMNVAIAGYFRPDVVVLNGDALDFDLISRYDHDRRRGKPDVFREVARPYRAYVKALADATPGATRIYLDGNHERRLEAFGNLAWQFGDTLLDAYAALVRADGRLLWANGSDALDIGPLLIHHGTRAGANAAKLSLEKDLAYGQSVVQGHSHGVGFYARRVRMPGGRYRIATSIEAGFAGNNPPQYIKRRSRHTTWIQACSVAHVDVAGDECHAAVVMYHERDGGLAAALGTQVFEIRAPGG